jgi:nitroimidazol reductase NimA-like FMN-containing flavoprotein (pyridoxamine 5'-phosphate oxidase superfamily)
VTSRPHETELVELTDDECRQLVRSKAIGRFAANRVDRAPLVVPVNYVVDDDESIVFRTGAGTKLDAIRHGIVALQVDEIDEMHHVGWSVVIEGHARWLPEEQQQAAVEPWAPGDHPYAVRLRPTCVTGRRIRLLQPDTDVRGYR